MAAVSRNTSGRHSQTDKYTITELSMASGPPLYHYVDVLAVRIVYSIIFVFFVETHKFQVAAKPWDVTTGIGKIPACKVGVLHAKDLTH